jgi:arginase
MGPSAFRAAGLAEALRALGVTVTDAGNLVPGDFVPRPHANPAVHHLAEVAAWTQSIERATFDAAADSMPILLGGDHSMAAGSLAGLARRAAGRRRPLFVLWLDSHPDFHTLASTESGNLHGVPMAYATGQPGFAGHFPPLASPLDTSRICMLGLRSVDGAERTALRQAGVTLHDMRAIDENGVATLLRTFLARVAAEDGDLHVSLDVDCLDPVIAPAVGTAVPGGLTYREAHLIMEMLHDCGRVRSLELAELNPFLDERGRTALLLVDLTASLMGRSILDRSP